MTIPSEHAPGDARRERLDALFAAHASAVFAFARRRASATTADDVVSETFLVAWRRLDDVPDDALPWLLGVSRKVLANSRRAASRQDALRSRVAAARLDGGHADDVADQATVDSVGDGPRILEALDALSPADRDAITLIAWDGLVPAEAAAVLGCSRATFYVRLHRARRRLTDLLGSDGRTPAVRSSVAGADLTRASTSRSATTRPEEYE